MQHLSTWSSHRRSIHDEIGPAIARVKRKGRPKGRTPTLVLLVALLSPTVADNAGAIPLLEFTRPFTYTLTMTGGPDNSSIWDSTNFNGFTGEVQWTKGKVDEARPRYGDSAVLSIAQNAFTVENGPAQAIRITQASQGISAQAMANLFPADRGAVSIRVSGAYTLNEAASLRLEVNPHAVAQSAAAGPELALGGVSIHPSAEAITSGHYRIENFADVDLPNPTLSASEGQTRGSSVAQTKGPFVQNMANVMPGSYTFDFTLSDMATVNWSRTALAAIQGGGFALSVTPTQPGPPPPPPPPPPEPPRGGSVIEVTNTDLEFKVTLSDLVVYGTAGQKLTILQSNNPADDIVLAPGEKRIFDVGFDIDSYIVSASDPKLGEWQTRIFDVRQLTPRRLNPLVNPSTGTPLLSSLDNLTPADLLPNGSSIDVASGISAPLPGWFIGTNLDITTGEISGPFSGVAVFTLGGLEVETRAQPMAEPSSIMSLVVGLLGLCVVGRRGWSLACSNPE